MKRPLISICLCSLLLAGCTTPRVAKLVDVIDAADQAAQQAGPGTFKKTTVSVTVANEVTAAGTVPVPVVPITLGGSLSESATIQVEVDLAKYREHKEQKSEAVDTPPNQVQIYTLSPANELVPVTAQ